MLPIRKYSLLLILFAAASCGASDVAKVNDTLTYKGPPVTDALLTFEPENGRQSWAETDAQGQFSVHCDHHQEGAAVGTHRVWVEQRPRSGSDQEAAMMGNAPKLSKDMAAFFSKYNAENSKLEVKIDRNTNDLALNLD
jgi:hypothetical protein